MNTVLTKDEFISLVNSVGIAAREGEQYLEDLKVFPKIAYWEYYWSDVMASGDDYNTTVTYQVSFASRTPRHPKLLALKAEFNNAGIHPAISHEYIKGTDGPGWYHSYFAVDIEEELPNGDT